MAWYNLFSSGGSNFEPYNAVLIAYANSGGSAIGGEAAVAADSEAAYVSVSLNASAVSQDGESAVTSSGTAVINTDDTTLTVTGEAEASGNSASASIDLLGIGEDAATTIGLVDTNASAVAGEDGAAAASTTADAVLAHDVVVAAEDHDRANEVGASATAESMATLSTLPLGTVEFDPLNAGLYSLGIGASLGQADWSL
jgi:hypothetical protein